MFVFELAVSLACIAGFTFLFIDALRMPYPQQFWDGPGAIPAVLTALLFMLSLYWLADVVKRKIRTSKHTEVEQSTSGNEEVIKHKKREETKRLILIMVLTVLYIEVLMPLIPFPIATFIFLFVTINLFRKNKQNTIKNWGIPLLVSIGMSLIVYLVFTFVLYIPMPR